MKNGKISIRKYKYNCNVINFNRRKISNWYNFIFMIMRKIMFLDF